MHARLNVFLMGVGEKESGMLKFNMPNPPMTTAIGRGLRQPHTQETANLTDFTFLRQNIRHYRSVGIYPNFLMLHPAHDERSWRRLELVGSEHYTRGLESGIVYRGLYMW